MVAKNDANFSIIIRSFHDISCKLLMQTDDRIANELYTVFWLSRSENYIKVNTNNLNKIYRKKYVNETQTFTDSHSDPDSLGRGMRFTFPLVLLYVGNTGFSAASFTESVLEGDAAKVTEPVVPGDEYSLSFDSVDRIIFYNLFIIMFEIII